jgi:hypothetical protein
MSTGAPFLAPGGHALAFARIVTDYEGFWYCVEFGDGTIAKRQIPDVEAILPHCMATPADIRSFMSREFRLDLAVIRNQGKLTPDQLECLAREEMKLNEVERMTANFGTSEAAETRH